MITTEEQAQVSKILTDALLRLPHMRSVVVAYMIGKEEQHYRFFGRFKDCHELAEELHDYILMDSENILMEAGDVEEED